MALGRRVASFVVCLVGVSFASCLAGPRLELGGEPLAHAARAVARRVHAASTRLKSSTSFADDGKWPEPSAAEIARLERESAEVRPASATTGDVFQASEDESEALPDAPESAVAPTPDVAVDPDRALAAISKETFVYASPRWGAKKVGYLRGGAVVRRSPDPVGTDGCPDGWFRIAPMGFVCVGKHATLDVHHPLVTAAVRRPDRAQPMPYAYGMSEFPTPPFYTRVPTPAQQAMVEPDLAGQRRPKLDPHWNDVEMMPIPDLLYGGRELMTWSGATHGPGSVYTGRALPKSGFAFLNFFESDGRKFGLTVDLDVVPLDRLHFVTPSAFHGVELGREMQLPVVFVMSKGAHAYQGDPSRRGLVAGRELGYREAVAVTGKRVKLGGTAWLETRAGEWIKDEALVRIDAMKTRPGWATPGRTWIDVSILKQALVAYEGTEPVYVTLVSTGADGLGDPKETHSTIRGQYLIHTKHVTATMSGDELGDEFDLRDVPYVQYFMDGYALHAAYWHDSFGHPRSHGCVNLSPIDARWLFHWTDPPVPQGWHGAMSLHDGTLVYIHP